MLNTIEEEKFAELRDKCRELKVPAPPEIFIGLQVHNRNGVLVFDDKQRGHSWTRNFWNALYSFSSHIGGDAGSSVGAGYMSAKVVAGTIHSGATYGSTFYSNAGITLAGGGFYNNAANTTFGILVGTGDTAFNVSNYAMGTLIAHGNSATQLSYQAMAAASRSYNAGTKTWKTTLNRIYNNNSGSSITVKETGLVWCGAIFTNTQSSVYLFERSVLDPTVEVANGAQLTVTYEISMDFSAID